MDVISLYLCLLFINMNVARRRIKSSFNIKCNYGKRPQCCCDDYDPFPYIGERERKEKIVTGTPLLVTTRITAIAIVTTVITVVIIFDITIIIITINS